MKEKLIMQRNVFFLFIISNVIMLCLLAGANWIPSTALRHNVEESYNLLRAEGMYPKFVDHDRIYFYDNYTDLLLVSTVGLQPEKNIFLAAIENNVSKMGIEEYSPMVGLEQLLEDETQYAAYPNYWCLLVALLKVLFLFFHIGEVRLMIFVLGLVLAGIISCKLIKNINIESAIGFFIALIGGGYILNVMCLAYSTDIILMYVGSLVIFKLYEKNISMLIRAERYIFFILGMLCFMLNYWSLPTLTLCCPLTIIILLKIKHNRRGVYIKDILVDSLCWGSGIGAEVLLRILVSKYFLGENTPLEHISMYTMNEGGGLWERVETVYYSVAKYFTEINKFIFIMAVVFCLFRLIVKRKKWQEIRKYELIIILEFALIALIPLAWIAVFFNHAFHGFDILPIGISSFAFISAMVSIAGEKEKLR